MKKKKIYSIPAKIITIAVLAVSAFLAALAGMRIAQGYWIGMTFSEMAHGTFYERSTAAAKYLYREGSSILASLQSENAFCPEGSSYDESLTIDIMNLDAGVDNEDKNPDTTYTLADLDNFYGSKGYDLLQYLVDYGESLTDAETVVVEVYTDTETDTGETEAESEYVYEEMGPNATRLGTETVVIDSIEDTDAEEAYYTYDSFEYTFGIYGSLANVLYNNGIAVEEDYILNDAGETLAEYARQYQDSVSILDCYKHLLTAAEELSEYLDSTEQSNAMVYVRNISTNDVYTNVEEWRDLSVDEVETSYLEKMGGEGDGTYYFYSETEWLDETTTGTMGDSDSLTTYGELFLDEIRASGAGYYQVFLGLNLNYPLRTSSSYTSHVMFAGWISHEAFFALFGSVGTFFIAFAVMAAMLVLAAFQTGRRPGDKEIHSALMDRFPLEIMILGDLMLWLFLSLWLREKLAMVYSDVLYSDVTYVSDSIVFGAVAAALLVLLFAWEWKHYGRRVKERALGGSLIRVLVRKVRSYRQKKCGAEERVRRLVGGFCIFIGIHFLFFLLGTHMRWRLGWGLGTEVFLFLILLTMDVLVLTRLVHQMLERFKITKGMEELAAGNLDYQVDAVGFTSENRGTADVFNSVREGIKHAVEVEMKSERLKTDLITNVSHDIKTPLTSIINYVDILKKEDFEDERIAGYIDILDRKSQRLKQLTEDLVEASKISSGVITLDIQEINLKQLLQQAVGEFDEKFRERNLDLVLNLTEKDMKIQADGRRMYRVIENLLNNAVKYSMPGSRVYVSGESQGRKVSFTMKNMSEQVLNFSAEELTERFVRGDVSRTTEGSGLGLEIAKNLTTMQGGDLKLYLDGDLFKVTVSFPV